MSSSNNIAGKSARTSSVSTVVGMSLVLFMLGSLALIVLNAQKLSQHVRENLQVQVYLYDELTDTAANELRDEIAALNYVKEAKFTTKQEAAKQMEAELGEDFIEFLGFNPLSGLITVSIKAEFANPEKIESIVRQLKDREHITDVVYSPDLIQKVNENINRIALILLAFSGVLLLISVALINNTIRLAIFSKRYVIKTMKLVGATSGFIRRPFLVNGFLQGVLASLIAVGLLAGAVYAINQQVEGFFDYKDIVLYAQVVGAIVFCGMTIAFFSTFLAVRRYINLKTEDVY